MYKLTIGKNFSLVPSTSLASGGLTQTTTLKFYSTKSSSKFEEETECFGLFSLSFSTICCR